MRRASFLTLAASLALDGLLSLRADAKAQSGRIVRKEMNLSYVVPAGFTYNESEQRDPDDGSPQIVLEGRRTGERFIGTEQNQNITTLWSLYVGTNISVTVTDVGEDAAHDSTGLPIPDITKDPDKAVDYGIAILNKVFKLVLDTEILVQNKAKISLRGRQAYAVLGTLNISLPSISETVMMRMIFLPDPKRRKVYTFTFGTQQAEFPGIVPSFEKFMASIRFLDEPPPAKPIKPARKGA